MEKREIYEGLNKSLQCTVSPTRNFLIAEIWGDRARVEFYNPITNQIIGERIFKF